MNLPIEASPRLWARVAGVSYLITIITGVFAEVFVRGSLVVRDDAAATATNLLAHESFYRLGLVADLIMLASYVVVTLLFYLLFKPAGRSRSLLAALFSMMGIAVLAVNSLNHLAPLVFLGDARFLRAFDAPQLEALAFAALKLHGRGYSIAGVFFGIYCILIGDLAFRSRFLPRIVGGLMAIGGLGYVTDSFTSFLSPALAARLPDLAILGGIAELTLCLWLMIVGLDASKWEERAR